MTSTATEDSSTRHQEACDLAYAVLDAALKGIPAPMYAWDALIHVANCSDCADAFAQTSNLDRALVPCAFIANGGTEFVVIASADERVSEHVVACRRCSAATEQAFESLAEHIAALRVHDARVSEMGVLEVTAAALAGGTAGHAEAVAVLRRASRPSPRSSWRGALQGAVDRGLVAARSFLDFPDEALNACRQALTENPALGSIVAGGPLPQGAAMRGAALHAAGVQLSDVKRPDFALYPEDTPTGVVIDILYLEWDTEDDRAIVPFALTLAPSRPAPTGLELDPWVLERALRLELSQGRSLAERLGHGVRVCSNASAVDGGLAFVQELLETANLVCTDDEPQG